MAAPDEAKPVVEELPEAVRPADQAFDRGDWAESARLARAVEAEASDGATKAAARTIAQRFTIDRFVAVVMAACVVMFVLAILVWH